MPQSRLIALTYFDPGKSARLTMYADTLIDRASCGPGLMCKDGKSYRRPRDMLALKNYLWQKPAEGPVVETELNRMIK